MNSFILPQVGARDPTDTAKSSLQSIRNQLNGTRLPFLSHVTCAVTAARRALEVISVHILLRCDSFLVKSWALKALQNYTQIALPICI